ncbi:MAG: S66 peptidase family protein [Nitritalea sp.]
MQKRTFLKKSVLGLAGLPLLMGTSLKDGLQGGSSTPLQPRLAPGDTIGLISPSSASTPRMNFVLAQETLEALGFRVKMGTHVQARRGHLAGTDAEKLADLHALYADPEVKAIMAMRGGSGAARLLADIDYALIRANPKPLIGYSDITALHCAIYSQTGQLSFHGPNATGSWNAFNVEQFRRTFLADGPIILENEQQTGDDLIVKQNRIETLVPGQARGKLLGGNLTVLAALSGTPYYPDFSGSILFLEEIGEDPYKLDRLFSTLKLNGTLAQIRGFVFGQCTSCDPSGGYGSLTLDEILDDYILPLGVPAYRGAMIGHVNKQFFIPLGAEASLDADRGTLTLSSPLFL